MCLSLIHISQKAFFDAVLQDLHIPSHARTVVVGDNLLSDIQGGINAGLDTIWYNPRKLPNPNGPFPTFEVSDFDALRTLLLC